MECHPLLTIIVPVLNEAEELEGLLHNLSTQRPISLEVVICDGGSTDGTPQRAASVSSEFEFPVRMITSAPGRAAQMNAASRAARGDLLLFLHVDSRFPDPTALLQALQAWKSAQPLPNPPLAAHFPLRFRRSSHTPSLAYFYYEAKTRLNRSDCIRGDQGLLLAAPLFRRLGGFDESLPFLEDVRMATAITREGGWLLLPPPITTSARRFEREGLLARQTLNAIIVNAETVGWTEFFEALPGLYRRQGDSGRLLLLPLLQGIRGLLARHPRDWRSRFWLATGRHVSANLWQLFFWLDVRMAFRRGLQPEQVHAFWLGLFNRYLQRPSRSLPMGILAATLVWLWHRTQLWWGASSTTETNQTG